METTKIIPSAEDIARVKAIGCLRDKTTDDCFNCRVITRNGKITAQEAKAIASAAEQFGNGEVAMTTRLTNEIQRVPYTNIEPLRAFLAQHGLERKFEIILDAADEIRQFVGLLRVHTGSRFIQQ